MKLTVCLVVLVGLGAAAIGCGGNNRQVQHAVVVRRAPFDFQCPRESLVVTHMGGDLWAVQGCGQRAVYNTNGLCSTTGTTAIPRSSPVRRPRGSGPSRADRSRCGRQIPAAGRPLIA